MEGRYLHLVITQLDILESFWGITFAKPTILYQLSHPHLHCFFPEFSRRFMGLLIPSLKTVLALL